MHVGVDIGGTKMLLIAGADAGIRKQVATGRAATAGAIAREIVAFVERLPAPASSIGVAVPGLVHGARVEDCDVLPALAGWSPGDALPIDAPVSVLNDAEAALVEEASTLGAGATAAVVVVGTGIGAAFQVDGRIVRGAAGWAGELGFSPISTADGVRTLDELASGAAILERLSLAADAVQARAQGGDERVLAALRSAGMAFGLGLATLVNLLNPELIALFGGTLRFPTYLDAALESARRHAHPMLLSRCAIRLAADPSTLVARGALRRARQSAGQ